MEFIKNHDHTEALRAAFPAFDSLSPEEKSELMRAWERKDRTILIQKFGLDSDASNIDSNSRVSPI